MKVIARPCSIDEFTLGLFSANGEDENGQFFILTIGFLLFQIEFLHYLK